MVYPKIRQKIYLSTALKLEVDKKLSRIAYRAVLHFPLSPIYCNDISVGGLGSGQNGGSPDGFVPLGSRMSGKDNFVRRFGYFFAQKVPTEFNSIVLDLSPDIAPKSRQMSYFWPLKKGAIRTISV
ncbi:hypothetical protein CRP01_35855 [Flavilitoribacter nigricans DSM 23189 = NBRC 102662]|uniref:Uncharacterized protein n=1 Tax=Flavilitoribacter nigricans (strain ATCC 23147 / DSM 23189 / NBRC 102662 / NCIMB 1420 / SS-2) TaxID=1122177 RepID=A0A2D0N1X7_FLAN2|nr:hypothetical protein CRP01_35855 [Flavilitoribacter nigricans DSM 23189 = NBRC 102662]